MRERGETTNAKRNMCSCHPTMCIISTPLPSPSRSLIPLCLPALLPSLLSLSFRYYTCVLTLITYVVLSYAFITHIVWLWLIFFIAHGKKRTFSFFSPPRSLSLSHSQTHCFSEEKFAAFAFNLRSVIYVHTLVLLLMHNRRRKMLTLLHKYTAPHLLRSLWMAFEYFSRAQQ